MIVFLQAEDGIRDLVRSRGLGDVYKRQAQLTALVHGHAAAVVAAVFQPLQAFDEDGNDIAPVSYTHLTLPTSDLV